VLKAGGKILGMGEHRCFSTTETGLGFNLPGWRYPLVLKDDGTLAFDDYNGHWGKVADLDALRSGYAVEVARAKANEMGMMTQDNADGSLEVFLPTGGSILISGNGTVEAQGIAGNGCQAPVEQFANAMGTAIEAGHKPEWHLRQTRITNLEG
jgi:hypothetical protein